MQYTVALTPAGTDPTDADDKRRYTLDLEHDTSNLLSEAKSKLVASQNIDRWALRNHWEVYAIEPPLVTTTKQNLQSSTTESADSYIPIIRNGQTENVWFHSAKIEGEKDVDFQRYNILDWLISFRFSTGGAGELARLFEAALHAAAHRFPEAMKRVNRARNIQSYESYTCNLTHKIRGLDGYPMHEFDYLEDFFSTID